MVIEHGKSRSAIPPQFQKNFAN